MRVNVRIHVPCLITADTVFVGALADFLFLHVKMKSNERSAEQRRAKKSRVEVEEKYDESDGSNNCCVALSRVPISTLDFCAIMRAHINNRALYNLRRWVEEFDSCSSSLLGTDTEIYYRLFWMNHGVSLQAGCWLLLIKSNINWETRHSYSYSINRRVRTFSFINSVELHAWRMAFGAWHLAV